MPPPKAPSTKPTIAPTDASERKPGSPGKCEANQDDVACHVCHEDPAETKDVRGVDDSGGKGQHEEQCRQWALGAIIDERADGEATPVRCVRHRKASPFLLMLSSRIVTSPTTW
jgi:hypothetical protein